MAKERITERAQAFSFTQKQQGNITATRSRNDVIRSVPLLHIRVNLGMMLAWDYASCHVARSSLVMYVANNVQKTPAKGLDLNPIDHLMDLLKRKVRE